MRTILGISITFLAATLWLGAQNLLPPIQNYKVFEYNAASKNWGLSVNEYGELYVANNSGLLHYDGEEWTLNKLPNKTIIRSVECIGKYIYTGSYEEFGYWQKDEFGVLKYTSLIHLIKDHEFTSEEFWQILPYKKSIIFRSFSGIYIYRDNKITVINPPFVITNITLYQDKVLVAGEHKRLFWLENEELSPLKDNELLVGKIAIDMDVLDDELLIGTKLNGCYLLNNTELVAFESNINNELRRHQLNQVLPLSNGKIAFGTIKNGVYLYDPTTKKYQNLNRETGLQNNTVLSMHQSEDQLWIGLDNGIDRIHLNNPFTYYTDYSGAVGTVYDLVVHDDTVYLGSNTGIHYFEENTLKFVEGSQGHVWDLEILEGELFCGHNTGTFKLNNGILEKVSDISGGYQIVKVPESRTSFLQGTYTGIVKYQKDDQEEWKTSRVQGNINFPVKQLCFENATTMWIAHPYKGFYRIKFDANRSTVVEQKEYTTDAIPNNYNIKLYNIKNQIVLLSEGIWYKYDPIPDKITVFEEFEDFKNMDLIHYDDEYFWFIDNAGSKEVIYTNLKDIRFILDDEQLRKRLAPEAENIVKANDSIYFFTLSDGFGILNLSKFRKLLDRFELPTPQLSSFMDKETGYAVNAESFQIPYGKSGDLTINFSAASLVNPTYYYELKGSMEQSSFSDNGTVKFQNIPFGEYELDISTVSMGNRRSVPKKVMFEILPPWYLSNWSIILYVALLLGIVFLVRRYNRFKLERKHTKLKEKLHREQEERLANLEKEKLAKEVKSKQKELASTTMNVAKKNELILELKALLIMNKDKFSNQQRYRAFMKKLDSSINDDEDWKQFEVNFKELHEDFFEKLLIRYPSLTSKDLKLSAYLKMNLSSKEIAPLMGISTRGIEIHRYRLRKKLQIDGSQNISNFLITFK